MVGQKKYSVSRIIFFIFVLIGCLFMLYPLIWMVVSSFKPEYLIFRDKSLIIREFTWFNYEKGFAGVNGVTFWDYLLNTFKVVIPVVIGTVISSAMAGYAFVRLHFVGKKLYFGLMIMTMMLPIHAMLIPRYMMFKTFGWLDTYLPLTIPSFFATGAFFVFLFVQFMRGIPSDIDEAAEIDGCNPINIFIRLIVPLSTPAILTASIFSFIWTYDDFFSQLIYINNPKKFTMALALRQYTEALELSAFGTLFAMSAVSLVPLFVFFIACQKYLVEGIATTGIKG